ncbi:MAG: sigma-70 family RNA polymerase sigma factor, partial [Bacteroidota bacterium]
MMGVCLRYESDYQSAQDILQDGFIKVFQNLHKYSGTGSFEGWIRRTVINTALDAFRKKKNIGYQLDVEESDFLAVTDANVLSDMAATDLLKVIHTLPMGYRTVFNLFAIEGYSHKEIA